MIAKRLLYLAIALLSPLLMGQSQVVCTTAAPGTVIAACGGAGLSSPVTSPSPLTWANVNIFDNAANTPITCSDGIIDSTLTAGRVTFAGASGRLTDDADMTFATDTLSATKMTVATTLTSPNLVSAAGVTEAISGTAPPVPANGATEGTPVTITASGAVPNAGAGTDGAAKGGSVTITAGAAARDTSGNAKGGDVILVGGAGIGTGVAGQVIVPVGAAAAPGIAFSGDTGTGFYDLTAFHYVYGVANGVENIRFGNNAGVMVLGPLQVLTSVGGAAPGVAQFATSVEAVTATKSPVPTEAPEIYTNGADTDGQAITLPNDPTVGTCYEFALTSTDTSNAFVIAPSAGETLSDAGTSCATVFSATAAGATCRICAVSGGAGAKWYVMSKNGTWTCTP